ncbi:hypothetical protein [Rhizobium leguminosarum]|uniref:hypothetical protein n=1 Tax=Rhizobium leguminosarum TaxID=384 RepID=UPI0021BC1D58|nr:hypothetical protein [Rhizobium leguminosarum]
MNDRAENSHVPLRKRERMMQGFRSVAACNVSSRSSQRSAIYSSHRNRNAQP